MKSTFILYFTITYHVPLILIIKGIILPINNGLGRTANNSQSSDKGRPKFAPVLQNPNGKSDILSSHFIKYH